MKKIIISTVFILLFFLTSPGKAASLEISFPKQINQLPNKIRDNFHLESSSVYTSSPALVYVGKLLIVDQATQTLRVYQDGVEIRILPASTGSPDFYTPAYSGYVGSYSKTIITSDGLRADNAWYIFSNFGRIYIHGAPYLFSNDGLKIYIGLEFLGILPSSHGCIRLSPTDAIWLTLWKPKGVPILITPPDSFSGD